MQNRIKKLKTLPVIIRDIETRWVLKPSLEENKNKNTILKQNTVDKLHSLYSLKVRKDRSLKFHQLRPSKIPKHGIKVYIKKKSIFGHVYKYQANLLSIKWSGMQSHIVLKKRGYSSADIIREKIPLYSKMLQEISQY